MRDGKVDGGSIVLLQGGGMRFHMVSIAIWPENLKFKGSLVAAANHLVKFAEPFTVLRRDNFIYVFPRDGVRARRSDQCQTGRIHEQQRSIVRDDLYAFGRRLDDCAELFLGLQLRSFALSNIYQHIDAANDAAGLVV